jgi:hypothetical protein
MKLSIQHLYIRNKPAQGKTNNDLGSKTIEKQLLKEKQTNL